ncbi:MAG: putative oxidoreductase FAD/NAD(P)-binding [Candidatus Nomurabacteria bacterium]|nr:putative oxidoreductase FAD/NAD(P)-binding [Candidatus Nomurabacteria bacterium]
MKYTTTLIKKEEIADGTMAFHFTKPEGFIYKAGQFLDWKILNPKEDDTEGPLRAFSILTAPHEDDIAFATRMRDTAFKRNLKNRDEVEMELDGPIGSFVLHQNTERKAVFLIGGIGITPVYSIIQDASHNNLPHKLTLFYSNRKKKDAALFKELEICQKSYPNFTFVPTFTEEEESWNGEKGYMDEDMIKRHVPDINNVVWYISGPQAMVGAMRKLLNDMKVSEDDIKTEEFSGY